MIRQVAILTVMLSLFPMAGCNTDSGKPAEVKNEPKKELPSREDQIVLTRLEGKVKTELQGLPLGGVIDSLTQIHQVYFDVRWDQLATLGIRKDFRVTSMLIHLDVKSALQRSLEEALYEAQTAAGKTKQQIAAMTNRPTFYVKDGIVVVTTTEAAEKQGLTE